MIRNWFPVAEPQFTRGIPFSGNKTVQHTMNRFATVIIQTNYVVSAGVTQSEEEKKILYMIRTLSH